MPCERACEPSHPCCAPGCPNNPPPIHMPEPRPGSQGPGGHGTVRIGVGNRSPHDININVYDNLVTGGRHRVHLGSGNHAAGLNTGFITGNSADCDDLQIGVDNYSEGGDNNVQVYNNNFRGGFERVHVGVRNYAAGSNTIIIGDGPPPLPPTPAAYMTEPSPAGFQGPDDGTVRIGVGNRSAQDINTIDVYDNVVTGGRQSSRVQLASGNHAAGANTGFITGNLADSDELQIGVDNYSAGGDNNVEVYNNDFRSGGFQKVRVGVGNYAAGSNNIVIGDGPPPLPPATPPPGFGPQKRRWFRWWF